MSECDFSRKGKCAQKRLLVQGRGRNRRNRDNICKDSGPGEIMITPLSREENTQTPTK